MTTESTNNSTAPAPKKSNKKMFVLISLALVLIFGANHLTLQVGYATLGISASDSTIVITPNSDTSMSVIRVEADTTKKDTVK
jgi:hypothetical protein